MVRTPEIDRSEAVIRLAHRLLCCEPMPDPANVLQQLVDAFSAQHAGVAAAVGESIEPAMASAALPSEIKGGLLERLRQSNRGLAIRAQAASVLVAMASAGGSDWLFWIIDGAEREWTTAECGAASLAAQALLPVLTPAKGILSRAADKAQRRQLAAEAARITGRLSHDFSNMLTAILGFAELTVANLPRESGAARFAREVWQSANEASQWVRKLQLFARDLKANLPPVNLASVVADQHKRLRSEWGEGIALVANIEPNLPFIAVEPEPLRHVLEQLLQNAREAIKDQGIVTISAQVVTLSHEACLSLTGDPEPGRHVEIVIADTGAGVSADTRRRLTQDIFFSTKGRHRGLGLAIVQGVLRNFQGGLMFADNPPHGTAAKVYLPAAEKSATQRRTCSQPKRILVVDDDQLILEYLRAVLQLQGYAVETASEPRQAIANFKRKSYDLLVTDVAMPEMNGFELARRLRRQDEDLNVVFISGQQTQVDRDLRDYPLLAKPFDMDGIVGAIKLALKRERLQPVG